MWALQFYVNQKLKIHNFKCIDDYADSATDQKVKVREALYENIELIDNLDKSVAENRNKSDPKSLKNWKPELEELASKAKKSKGTVQSPAIYSPAFSLVKASIEFAQLAVSDANDQEGLYKALQKVRRAFNKSNTVLYREEY